MVVEPKNLNNHKIYEVSKMKRTSTGNLPKLEKEGLLKIIKYRTDYEQEVGADGSSIVDVDTITTLEILSDNHEPLPIEFHTYVGWELNNQRVFYSEKRVGNLNVTDVYQVAQMLLPIEQSLPSYSTCYTKRQGGPFE